MSGRKSKNKGYRNEQGLVHKLRAEGEIARRVPLSGGMLHAPGDVEVIRGDTKLLIEVKSRAKGLAQIYEFYEKEIKPRELQDETYSLGFIADKNNWIVITDSFKKVAQHDKRKYLNFYDKYEVLFRRVKAWKNTWLKECDILAIKMDYKNYLFFRYD